MSKQNASMMGVESSESSVRTMSNYVLETSLVDGKMFLKASLHGAKRKRGRVGGGGGGGGGGTPPFAHTASLSRVLRRSGPGPGPGTRGPRDQMTRRPHHTQPGLGQAFQKAKLGPSKPLDLKPTA